MLSYFAGLRYVEKHANKKAIRHNDVFALHKLLAEGVMDQGDAGVIEKIGSKKNGRYVLRQP